MSKPKKTTTRASMLRLDLRTPIEVRGRRGLLGELEAELTDDELITLASDTEIASDRVGSVAPEMMRRAWAADLKTLPGGRAPLKGAA